MSLLQVMKDLALRELANQSGSGEAVSRDSGFIRDFQHRVNGAWNRYVVQLDVPSPDWETMLHSAEYLRKTDLEPLSTLTVGDVPGTPNRNLYRQYEKARGSLTGFPPLHEEQAVLSIGGHSRALGSQVEIVWTKHSPSVRLYTMLDNKARVRDYVETLVRRSFGG